MGYKGRVIKKGKLVMEKNVDVMGMGNGMVKVDVGELKELDKKMVKGMYGVDVEEKGVYGLNEEGDLKYYGDEDVVMEWEEEEGNEFRYVLMGVMNDVVEVSYEEDVSTILFKI